MSFQYSVFLQRPFCLICACFLLEARGRHPARKVACLGSAYLQDRELNEPWGSGYRNRKWLTWWVSLSLLWFLVLFFVCFFIPSFRVFLLFTKANIIGLASGTSQSLHFFTKVPAPHKGFITFLCFHPVSLPFAVPLSTKTQARQKKSLPSAFSICSSVNSYWFPTVGVNCQLVWISDCQKNTHLGIYEGVSRKVCLKWEDTVMCR